MGLDISVITKWAYATTPCVLDEHAMCTTHLRLDLSGEFPDQVRDLQPGCIDVEARWVFRAGSYSWYNLWRDHLCRAANGFPVEEIWMDPYGEREALFWELLNFSDCQGTLGPAACAACAGDMRAYMDGGAHERYLEGLEGGLVRGFDESMKDWSRAFEETSAGGLLLFH